MLAVVVSTGCSVGAATDQIEGDRCPDCGGERLNPEARSVRVAGHTIVECGDLEVSDLVPVIRSVDHEPSGFRWLEAFVITLIVNALARWLVWRVTRGAGAVR